MTMMDSFTAQVELDARRAYVTQGVQAARLFRRLAACRYRACRNRLFAALSDWLIDLGTWLRQRYRPDMSGV